MKDYFDTKYDANLQIPWDAIESQGSRDLIRQFRQYIQEMRDKFEVRIDKLRERQKPPTLRVGNVDFGRETA